MPLAMESVSTGVCSVRCFLWYCRYSHVATQAASSEQKLGHIAAPLALLDVRASVLCIIVLKQVLRGGGLGILTERALDVPSEGHHAQADPCICQAVGRTGHLRCTGHGFRGQELEHGRYRASLAV